MICILVISLPLSQSNHRVSADTFKSKEAQSLNEISFFLLFLLLVNTKNHQRSQIFWSIILIKDDDDVSRLASEKVRARVHTFFSKKWNKLSKHWFLMAFHLFVSANLRAKEVLCSYNDDRLWNDDHFASVRQERETRNYWISIDACVKPQKCTIFVVHISVGTDLFFLTFWLTLVPYTPVHLNINLSEQSLTKLKQ